MRVMTNSNMETNSICERFHQWIDGIFIYYNTQLWTQTTKVKPHFYCKERWNGKLPSKKDTVDNDFIIIPIRDSEQELEQKYLNGYPNGVGKRHSIDSLV